MGKSTGLLRFFTQGYIDIILPAVDHIDFLLIYFIRRCGRMKIEFRGIHYVFVVTHHLGGSVNHRGAKLGDGGMCQCLDDDFRANAVEVTDGYTYANVCHSSKILRRLFLTASNWNPC